MSSRTVMVAVGSFGELSAGRVAAAVERGLRAADKTLTVDCLPIESEGHGVVSAAVREALDAAGFDARMRAARAVVVGASRLDERTLVGSATFEIATRARQAGVPAYAVTAENAMSAFEARMLDLQVILQARDARALRRAGERLAGLV